MNVKKRILVAALALTGCATALPGLAVTIAGPGTAVNTPEQAASVVNAVVTSIDVQRGVLKDELPASVAQADGVYVYSAGLGWDAAQVFGGRARCIGELDALVAAVCAEARPGDHVLVMSNGGFGGIHDKLLARLAKGRDAEAAA